MKQQQKMEAFRPAILSLNPCIDTCVYLPSPLCPGRTHRAERTVQHIGGKGLNQAIVFRNLGVAADYYSFGSQNDKDAVDEEITSQRVCYHKISAACGIRENLKIVDADGVGTEINQRGGPITPEEMAQMERALASSTATLLSVCGSIPVGVRGDVYRQIISDAKQKGMVTVLDAAGEALALGMEACPDLIKPNRHELAGLCGVDSAELADEKDVIRRCCAIYEKYGTTVLHTMDEQGSLYVGKEGIYRAGIAKYPMRGFSGAGDTYLAAFLYATFDQKMQVSAALAFAARAAAAKIALDGTQLPTREQIDAVGEVEVREI
jgi:1-phosphofructokinase